MSWSNWQKEIELGSRRSRWHARRLVNHPNKESRTKVLVITKILVRYTFASNQAYPLAQKQSSTLAAAPFSAIIFFHTH
jgi:hypothetical protein